MGVSQRGKDDETMNYSRRDGTFTGLVTRSCGATNRRNPELLTTALYRPFDRHESDDYGRGSRALIKYPGGARRGRVYSIDQIRTGLRLSAQNPKYLLRELNIVVHRASISEPYNDRGVNVFSRDWDTLVLLDGCRYDTFARRNSIGGDLTAITSRGSHTSEFLRGNFDGRTLQDTVYTTASPQLERRRDEIDVALHAVENVWDTEKWDEALGTVRPEAMTAAAVAAHERYPDKRHVVHYIQPHYPFIESRIDVGTRGLAVDSEDGVDFWGQLMRGDLDVDAREIRRAYERNLDLALEAVEDMLEAVDGKVVVTSDHGNVIGERVSPIPIREWGHPPRLYVPELVTVPWLECGAETRRTVRSHPPEAAGADVDSDRVSDRLESLGYV